MPNERPGCLGTILQYLGLMSKQAAPINEIFPYALRDDFLSPSELSFYKGNFVSDGCFSPAEA